LIFKVKIGESVIADGEFQLVPDIADDVQVGIHVEIKTTSSPGPFRKSWILDILALVPRRNIHITLRTDIYLPVAEDPVKKIVPDRQFRTQELFIQGAQRIRPFPEIFILRLLGLQPQQFVESKVSGLSIVVITNFLNYIIDFIDRVVFDGIVDIHRVPEIEWVLVPVCKRVPSSVMEGEVQAVGRSSEGIQPSPG